MQHPDKKSDWGIALSLIGEWTCSEIFLPQQVSGLVMVIPNGCWMTMHGEVLLFSTEGRVPFAQAMTGYQQQAPAWFGEDLRPVVNLM